MKKIIIFTLLVALSLQLSGCTICDLFGIAFYKQKPGARIISQSEAEILLNWTSAPVDASESAEMETPKPTPISTITLGDNKRDDDYIYFGSYPQSEVTDLTFKAKLKESAGSTSDWTSYDYYIKSSTSSFMKYKDVTYEGNKYRGVYFTQFRPYYTSNNSSRGNSYQDDNGYNTNTFYWFKYEPIRWKIISESNGVALLLADMILDAQDYGTDNYSNTYENAKIRKWLNETFLNTAFNSAELNRIKTENDKIFLLSKDEATSASYGLGNGVSRVKDLTAYAKVQGASSYSYSNTGWWWLMSKSNNSDHSLAIFYDGLAYENIGSANGGVAPALHLTL